jgi:hypothetical protein
MGPPPDHTTTKYAAALERAWTSLGAMDKGAVASNALVQVEGERLRLPFLSGAILIDLKSRGAQEAGKEMEPFEVVLALHYLIGATKKPLAGELISFNEVPSGPVYYSAFKQRAIDHLVQTFGSAPATLMQAGKRLGGEVIMMGDAAVRIPLFPKLPLTLALWSGDEEVPPSGSVLFDRTAPHLMPFEDLAVAASLVLARLMTANKDL